MVTKINKKVAQTTRGKTKPTFKQQGRKIQNNQRKYEEKTKRRQERQTKEKAKQKRAENDDNDDEDRFDEIDGSDYDEEMEKVQEDLDADKNLDESIFNQYETGELDLPSDAESDGSDVEMSDQEDADDLDEYYRELGIDPEEMKPQNQSKQAKKTDAVYVTKEKKETAEQAKQRQRSELLERMMQRAREQPNYKILNRIIQVVKSVFTDTQSDQDGADDTGKKDKTGKPIVKESNKKSAV